MELEQVGGVLMALVGLLTAFTTNRVWRVEWRWMAIGAMLWLVSVLEKWQIDNVLHQPVLGGLQAHLSTPLYLTLGSVYIGLLTGVTEVAVVLVAGLLWPGLARSADRAVGIGLGAGAFEAVFLGVQTVAEGTPGATTFPAAVLAPTVERVIVIACHTAVRVWCCTPSRPAGGRGSRRRSSSSACWTGCAGTSS